MGLQSVTVEAKFPTGQTLTTSKSIQVTSICIDTTFAKMYPSPCAEQVNVDFTIEKNTSPSYIVEFKNLLGKTMLIEHGTLHDERTTKVIHLQHGLPNGIYLVFIQVGDHQQIVKQIIGKD